MYAEGTRNNTGVQKPLKVGLIKLAYEQKYTFVCKHRSQTRRPSSTKRASRDLRRRGAQRHERSRAAGRPRGLRLLPASGAGRLGRRLGADIELVLHKDRFFFPRSSRGSGVREAESPYDKLTRTLGARTDPPVDAAGRPIGA